jgi:protein TonB
MENQETIVQMDEIVFEHRNKSYGAYILRKMYNKQLNRAMLLTVAILAAGLAYPLVSSYNSRDGIRLPGDTVEIDLLDTPKPEDEIKPELPELPPAEPETRVRFVAPEPTLGDVIDEGGLPDMEYLNQSSVNIPVNVSFEKPAEKPVEVIEDPEKAPALIIVEEMPVFPGGDTERQKFLAETIQYPQQAAENAIQGTVYVQFVVDSKGNITDVKILRGIGGGCDEEALRVIKMMPTWKPGRQNGKTVRVLYNMPVIFKLQ